MGMTLEELVTKLGFEVDDKALKQLDASIETVKAGVLGLAVSFGGAGAAIYEVVETTAKATFEALRLSETIGITVQSLEKLSFAGKMAGLDQDELAQSLVLLNRRMGMIATQGSPEAIRAFQKVGISYAEITSGSLKTDTALKRISDRFKNMPEGPQRTALAMELFGRSGARLIPLLLEGSKGIETMGDEAQELGLVMTDAQVKAAVAFRHSTHFMESFFEGVKNQVGAGLMPAITNAIDEFNKFLVVNRELIKNNLTGFIKGLTGFLKASIGPIKAVALAIAGVAHSFGGAEKATKLFVGAMAAFSAVSILFGIGRMVSALWTLTWAFEGILSRAFIVPLAIGALAAALALAAEDLYQYFHGGRSVFGMIVNDFDGLIKALEERFPKITKIFEYMKTSGHAIKSAWNWVMDTDGLKQIQSNLKFEADTTKGQQLRSKFDSLSSSARPLTGTAAGQNFTPYSVNPNVTINMLPHASPDAIASKVHGAIKGGVTDAMSEARRHSANASRD